MFVTHPQVCVCTLRKSLPKIETRVREQPEHMHMLDMVNVPAAALEVLQQVMLQLLEVEEYIVVVPGWSRDSRSSAGMRSA